jgi:hypothetical protein
MVIVDPESDDEVPIHVEFPEMILTADRPESVGILTRAGLALLGRSRPVANVW